MLHGYSGSQSSFQLIDIACEIEDVRQKTEHIGHIMAPTGGNEEVVGVALPLDCRKSGVGHTPNRRI